MKWTKIDVSNVNRSAVKWKVIVCNIIIMALCVASMLTMALGKFWVVDANLTINKAMADKLFGANASVDTSSFETNPVELQLKFGITSKMVLLGVVQDNEKIANSLIDEQVNSLMTQFRPMLGNVARMVVQAVKPQIESALSDV